MVLNMDTLWPPKNTPAIHTITLYNTDTRSYERQQRHQASIIIIQASKVEAARIGERKARVSVGIQDNYTTQVLNMIVTCSKYN